MTAPRFVRAACAGAMTLLLVVASNALRAAPARAGQCDSCVVAVDSCCSKMPHIADPVFQPPARGVIETREPDPAAFPYCVTLYDITQNIPAENVNWNPITRYHGPGNSWNATNLGTVFGLTLDKYGNIYVTHTSAYSNDLLGPGGAGMIYRIDGTTGAITSFLSAPLPNFADPSVSPGSNMPGLGNISYDCDHDQFFVTNMEDGRIYRIKSSNANNASPATVLNFFDPGAPDNGLPGWAPLNDRLWAVQWHSNRVYYSVWGTDFGSPAGSNKIRSIALDGSGDFVWFSDRLELVVPSFPTTPGQSGPVSDMSFGPTGRMLLGERSMVGPTTPSAHTSRVLEYQCDQVAGGTGGSWAPSGNTFKVGQIGTQDNAAGGVDYDFNPYDGPSPPATAAPGGLGGSAGRIWATGDAIHFGSPNPDIIYGEQAFRPTGGTIANSLLIDSDGNVGTTDKTFIGDVEVPCPGPPIGKICGKKYFDENHNGVKDGTEVFLAGWTIQLSGPVNATVVTDQNGNFCFNNLPAGTYTVTEVNQPGWIQSQPPGGSYTVTLPPDVLNLAFGNYRCVPDNCVTPPLKMTAWWPLDEPAGPVAHDIVGANNGTWQGAVASIVGMVGRAIRVTQPADYVAVGNSGTINFGTGDFSMDCWVRSTDSTLTGVRQLIEHRTGTTSLATGYALFMLNNRLAFQMGDAGGHSNFLAPVTSQNLANGQWHHIAATVIRNSTTGGKLIVDGTVVLTFDPTGRPGSVTNSGPLWIGQRNVSGPVTVKADIDEVELFSRSLALTEVQSLYNAGSAGKCKKTCYVPSVQTYSAGQTSMTVCFQICNYDWSQPSLTFNWTMAGLPAGGPCTIAGPTVFSPSSGTVVVPAGSCQAVCVVIQRPAGLIPGQVACYQLTAANSATNFCCASRGSLKASKKWIHLGKPGEITKVPSGGASIHYSMQSDAAGGTFNYQIVSAPYESDPSGNAVRLNGLPPGEPVIGTLSVAPGQTFEVGATATYAPPIAIPIHEVILYTDLEDNGVLTPSCAIPVLPDSSQTTAAPQPETSGSIEEGLGYPNPFEATTGVRFSMQRAQNVNVRVFDVNGRMLKVLHSGSLGVGPQYVKWDGMDSGGKKAGAGIYFIRVDMPDRTINAKVVRMK